MTVKRGYIAGMGIVTPLGEGVVATENALRKGVGSIRPLTLFRVYGDTALPAGEVSGIPRTGPAPRTHLLARKAADQAMDNCRKPPDAVVMGITTGGMLETEGLLKQGLKNPELFRLHSPGTVCEDIAARFKCKGPVLTVSTACSSGAVAIIIALKMIRAGVATRVLAGGADSLCRLTYCGFNSLQLIDSLGARPFDQKRNCMSVGEGAAMLFITSEHTAKDCPE
ncbi:MAG: 3-oxoacyl-ACP synthase, partial [Deltaproteobacteria bacterium]|nr:3-oxoacyl-ACP synthase [Deltaproteobacteria bacterium]